MIPLADASILIVGIVRDCETTVCASVVSIRHAFSPARQLAFFVVESDSQDRTTDQLRSLELDLPGFRYLSLGALQQRYGKRVERIAYCRNVCIQEALTNPLYEGVDYVVIADLDGVNDLLTPEAVQTCWAEGRDWDVCCANQWGPYYDVWALRHSLWSPGDCWEQSSFLRAHGVDKFSAISSSVISRMIVIPPEALWIQVESAFGGCAVYRREVLKDVEYVGLNSQGHETCEHVSVNQQISSRGGRIFINPAFLNTRFVEHSRRATLLGVLRFWFRCQRERWGLAVEQ